jgi:hypothetical protein
LLGQASFFAPSISTSTVVERAIIVSGKDSSPSPTLSPKEERRERLLKIVQRDTTFLDLGAILATILGWIEVNSGNAEYRGEDAAASVNAQRGIIDTGYIVTKPIHDFLRENRSFNDLLAFINTIIGVLLGPGI